MIYDVTSV